MCLIVVQPAGSEMISREFAKRAWDQNDDGAGYMYARAGEVVVRKPFFSFSKFWQSYKRESTRYSILTDFVVHFRFATHGKKNYLNTHPHVVSPGKLAVAHNGIINIKIEDKSLSDTVTFVRESLSLLREQPELIWVPDVQEEIREVVGWTNKLAFLGRDGKAVIINKGFGHDRFGHWHSSWVSEYASIGFTKFKSGEIWSPRDWQIYRGAWDDDEDMPAKKAYGAGVCTKNEEDPEGWKNVFDYCVEETRKEIEKQRIVKP